MRFDSVDAQQILNSRGYPTVTVGLGVAGGQPVQASTSLRQQRVDPAHRLDSTPRL